jgi:hypothetical protein
VSAFQIQKVSNLGPIVAATQCVAEANECLTAAGLTDSAADLYCLRHDK